MFRDPSGKHWLLVALGDTEAPLRSLSLDAAGNIQPGGATLLARQFPWEYHFIEQPSMVYDATRKNYLLTYSAGKWWERNYSTGLARCSSPTGPCTADPSGPWIGSSNGRTGPGGLSFFSDTSGTRRAIFSTFREGGETTVGGRSASIMPLTLTPAVGLGTVTK